MSGVEYITAEQAIEAIERCAFADGDRMVVHCFSGGIGCDWSVDAAIGVVHNAYVHEGVPQIAWADSLLGRCLVVVEADPPGKGGRQRAFDTVVPA